MHEVASAEHLRFSSSCDLTISSNLKTLIQTIFVALTILTKTHDITLSIGVKILSLFHTQYWMTSLISNSWVGEAGGVGLEAGIQYVKLTVWWFVTKLSPFFFRHRPLSSGFTYLGIFYLFPSNLSSVTISYSACESPQMLFPQKMIMCSSFFFSF